MSQRVAKGLHHFTVDFDFAAVDPEFYFLAKFNRDVAQHARQRREKPVDILHPHLADSIAHFGNRGG